MMSAFEKASKVFESSFLKDDYFESMSAEFAKNSLIHAIKNEQTPLLFLLGDPGVGKTYMLHLLKEDFTHTHRILMASEPFATPESLLQFLLTGTGHDSGLSLLELKERAVNIYKNIPHIIMIDEAQLLSESILEYIRILSDTKAFRFILSMHREEGELIVKKKHFASRDHKVVTIGLLEQGELKHFLESQLLRHELGNMAELFKTKELVLINRYAAGNFRMIKQMLKRIFSLMDYAKTNALKPYVTPNKCIVMMAAIDMGCIDA
jgi:predicted AAA+ superfamily ATPase